MDTFYHPRYLWMGTFYHPRFYRSITHTHFVISPTQGLDFLNPDNKLQNPNYARVLNSFLNIQCF